MQVLANTPGSCCLAELQALQSALSAEELKAKGEQLQKQLADEQAKLATLKLGKNLITKEQSNKVEKVRQTAGQACCGSDESSVIHALCPQGFQRYMEAWSKQKRVFKDIWCVQLHLLFCALQASLTPQLAHPR